MLWLFRGSAAAQVQVILVCLSTQMDVLAASLSDLFGPLGLKISACGGKLADSKRDRLARHFVEDWGRDPAYIARALPVIEQNWSAQSQKTLHPAFARLCRDNPDCRYAVTQADSNHPTLAAL